MVVGCVALGGCALAAVSTRPEVAPPGLVVSPVDLQFTEIAAGSLPGGAGSAPALSVVRVPAELAALLRCIDLSEPSSALATNLSQEILIVAFLGLRPSGGYSLRLQAVAVQGDLLVATVLPRAPAPGAPVTQGFETPFHVVKARLSLQEAQSLSRYRLVDVSGRLLKDDALGGPICPSGSAVPEAAEI